MVSLKIYRYRSVKRALEEIENGTWYFASREELNDPIEGYVRVYWQGDKPAWAGLFRNYICSLCAIIFHYSLTGEKTYASKPFEEILKDFRNHSMLNNIHQFDSLPLGIALKELRQQFLNNSVVQGFIKFYGENKIKCSAKELHLILTAIHNIAFSACVKKLQIVPQNYIDVMSFAKPFPVEQLQNLDESERKKILELFSDMLADNLEWGLSFNFNIMNDNPKMNLNDKQQLMNLEVQLNYPAIYISQLKELLYPNGYVICFSEQKDNSAMWGNYAQNHTGVCLVYETHESNGKDVISLARGKVELAKVNYSDVTLQKNFFDTLVDRPYNELEYWLTDENGKRSDHLKEKSYYEANTDWRRGYWKEYKEKFFTKLTDWTSEQEYRALFCSREKLNNPIAQTLTYDPSALKGIIFGINTSAEDRIKLIQKIRSASQLSKDFKFYQAEYDDDLQKIIIRGKQYLSINEDRKKQIQEQVMNIGANGA